MPPENMKPETPPKELTIIVHSPRTPQAKPFKWNPKMLVGVAADEAAAAFGYGPGSPSFMLEDGTVLDRNVTLEVSNLKNGSKVEIVDRAGGV